MKAKLFGTALLCVFYMNGMQRLAQVIAKMCSKGKKRIHSVSNTIAATTINTLRVDFVRFVSGQPLEHLSHYFHFSKVAVVQGGHTATNIATKQKKVVKTVRNVENRSKISTIFRGYRLGTAKIGQNLQKLLQIAKNNRKMNKIQRKYASA